MTTASKPQRSHRERYLLARAAAVRTMPYMETLIVSMGYTVSDRVTTPQGTPTMAVTEKAQCLVHPVFLDKIASCGGIKALAFVIAHEAWHILLRHPARRKALMERFPDFDVNLAGIAADISINPALRTASEKVKAAAMGIALPTGECTGVFPEQFGLDQGLTYEMYYALLVKKHGANGKPQQGQGSGGKPQPGDCPGQGCSPSEDGEGKLSDDAKKLAEEVGGGWSEVRTERMVRATLEKAAKHEAANRGSIPAGLLLDIEEALKPPRIRWQDAVMSLALHAAEHRPGATDAVWTAPSRRQAGLGNGVGCPRMPGMVEYVPKFGVIQDTSGSMCGTLESCVAEILGLIAHTGGEVEMVFCDTVATDGGRVATAHDIVSNMRGGGGTDMNAALDMLQKKQIDVGICFTDGYIGNPGHDRGYPLIFVLTPNGGEADIAAAIAEGWASMIRMEPDDLP